MKKVILGLLLITALFVIACEVEEDLPEIINGEIIDPDPEIVNGEIEDPDEVDDEVLNGDDEVDDDVLNGDDEETVETIESIQTEFEEGLLTYEILVNKPTPCHEVETETTLTEENILEIGVMLIETDEICAQVITPETVVGEIETDIEPEDVLVFLI